MRQILLVPKQGQVTICPQVFVLVAHCPAQVVDCGSGTQTQLPF
jgi:hypothetical protein